MTTVSSISSGTTIFLVDSVNGFNIMRAYVVFGTFTTVPLTLTVAGFIFLVDSFLTVRLVDSISLANCFIVYFVTDTRYRHVHAPQGLLSLLSQLIPYCVTSTH